MQKLSLGRRGFIKCRLVHLRGRTIILPEMLFSNSTIEKTYWVPDFFYPPEVSFVDAQDDEVGGAFKFVAAGLNGIEVQIAATNDGVLYAGDNGSLMYKCVYDIISDDPREIPWRGKFRKLGNRFEIRAFHHTTPEGEEGIRNSRELWTSCVNIQGDKQTKNIAFGYFTSLPRIRGEFDLLPIAMSRSGVASMLPVNAPFDPSFATEVKVPGKQPRDLARSLLFWISSEDLYPPHILIKLPEVGVAYYEIVHPMILRIGCEPGTKLRIGRRSNISVPAGSSKQFPYIVVGDGDTAEGLAAVFDESEATDIGKIEILSKDNEIVSFWSQNKNTDLFTNKQHEMIEFEIA